MIDKALDSFFDSFLITFVLHFELKEFDFNIFHFLLIIKGTIFLKKPIIVDSFVLPCKVPIDFNLFLLESYRILIFGVIPENCLFLFWLWIILIICHEVFVVIVLVQLVYCWGQLVESWFTCYCSVSLDIPQS